VFGNRFRELKYLIIRFTTLFLLLRVVLLVLSVFADFKFTSLKHVIKRCFLRSCRLIKLAKKALRHPTWRNRAKYHGLGRVKNKETK